MRAASIGSAHTLPPEHVHFEAADFDQTVPGHVMRLPLKDGRVLVCHMNTETAERLRLDHVASPLSRPALRYHGGKWRLAKWIIGNFPEHVCYVEPFGGAFSVGFRKKPSTHEVWNDIDGDLLIFWTVLRERTAELVRAIELTPFSRAELSRAFGPTDGIEDLERARRLVVKAGQCRGSIRNKSGWRFEVTVPPAGRNIDRWNTAEHLWAVAARMKNVQIESDDALCVIRRYDSEQTLFYVDPPYVTATRGARWENACMGEMDDRQHGALADQLHRVNGHVIVSGYPSPLYDRLYSGWRVESRKAQTQAKTEATECLWISPPAEERRKLWRDKRAYGQLEMSIAEAAG